MLFRSMDFVLLENPADGMREVASVEPKIVTDGTRLHVTNVNVEGLMLYALDGRCIGSVRGQNTVQLPLDANGIVIVRILLGDEEVQLFFEKSISKERDEFARFYAITSWTDITVSKEDVSEDIRFIRRVRKVQKTDWGKLACWYALYLFGEESGFKKFLKFLQSRDWKIRLNTLYLLENPIRFQDFSEKQLIIIRRKLKELLKQGPKQEPFVQVRNVTEKLIHLIDTGEEIDS